MSRYQSLRELVRRYGEATAEQNAISKELGRSIISGFF